MFDLIICHGPNDDNILDLNIEYNKKNIIGYRNIFIITYNKNLIKKDCIVIDESIFPFTIDTIKKYITSTNNRYGWYLQQLLKLYAGDVIPDILDTYLVIDCDTLFLQPTTFIDNGKLLYNFGTEYHKPYFEHMSKMNIELTKQKNISGICHHMIFSNTILKEFKQFVEKDNYKLWEIILLCIDNKHIDFSGCSEYEMYFNYIIKYHSDKITIRELKWENVYNLNHLNSTYLNYISYHHYMR